MRIRPEILAGWAGCLAEDMGLGSRCWDCGLGSRAGVDHGLELLLVLTAGRELGLESRPEICAGPAGGGAAGSWWSRLGLELRSGLIGAAGLDLGPGWQLDSRRLGAIWAGITRAWDHG